MWCWQVPVLPAGALLQPTDHRGNSDLVNDLTPPVFSENPKPRHLGYCVIVSQKTSFKNVRRTLGTCYLKTPKRLGDRRSPGAAEKLLRAQGSAPPSGSYSHLTANGGMQSRRGARFAPEPNPRLSGSPTRVSWPSPRRDEGCRRADGRGFLFVQVK